MRDSSKSLCWVACLGLALAGCSSSGSTPPVETRSVGGTLTGLAPGASVVLLNNGGNPLTLTANGAFTFTAGIALGASYRVTVGTQPSGPTQVCTVAGGTGTIGTSNVTSVSVDCVTSSFTVGGTVSGLLGTGLVLQVNGGNDLPILADGAFTFATPIPSGATYAVTVRTKPSAPAQICSVSGGSGRVGAGNVDTVSVVCSVDAHTVGGTVSGLAGIGLVLLLDGGGNLPVATNGEFVFPAPVAAGASYAVTVLAQPTSPVQACTVTNGTGIMGSANVTGVVVTCTTLGFTVGGTVTGLVGSGLVLANGGANQRAIFANGTFAFTQPVQTGSAYDVTVVSQPTSPAQLCSVTGGSGTMGSANVTSVSVSCVTRSFAIGGTVSGLAGTGLVLRGVGGASLPITANGAFAFPSPVASGTAYAVTAIAQPTGPTQLCTVAGGTGVVGNADVTGIAVTCVTNGFTVGGTVTGLDGRGLVLRNNGGNDLPIAGNGAFRFGTAVSSGSAYAVTIASQPTGPAQACTVANGSGTVAGANVTNVVIDCPPAVVLQEWRAPASWGGGASFWPDGDPDMVEHLTFDPALTERGGIAWIAPDGAPATDNALPGVGSTGVTRYAAGPFNAVTPGTRYVAASGDGVLDLQGDMLVCAVVKPDWNPVVPSVHDRIIFAKGVRGISGWALMQSSVFFSFRYQSTSGEKVAFTETDFAMPELDPHGPLNASYVVLCGGRDVAGGRITLVANGIASSKVTDVPAADALVVSPNRASLGGYEVNDPLHAFGGRVYETAVWRIPASLENIEAKMAPVLGLGMPGGSGLARYLRDRDGYYPGAVVDPAPYHTAWKHQPRIDPSGKGVLFGLQATNRVPYAEALEFWGKSPATGPGSPVVTPDSEFPPGDAGIRNVSRVWLPPGSAISITLGNFGDPGALHGQIWLRKVSAAGSLTIASETPPAVSQGAQVVDLAPMAGWTRVQVTDLTTDGNATDAGRGTLFLRNDGITPVEFHAWGVVLTQIGREIAGGGSVAPLGFDPGPTIYGSLAPQATRETLTLPAVTLGSAGTGFCIGAEAQPATGMTWAGPFRDRRTLVEWQGTAVSDRARIFVLLNDGPLKFAVQSAAGAGTITVPLPPSLAVDTVGRLKGCVAANGDMSLYVNDALVGSGTLGAPAPDAAGGTLSVGSDHSGTEPWHGYVKAAVICRNLAPLTSCLAP